MTVREIREAIQNLPDEVPIQLYMGLCPADNLNVVLEGVYPNPDINKEQSLIVCVSILTDAELSDTEE